MTEWDARYAEPEFVYGKEPNDFLVSVAARIPPGPVLCLAEGQGRNAVYLATLGHEVTAVDRSGVGLARARELAQERGVRITTIEADLGQYTIAPGAWAGIVAIFMHLPKPLRSRVYRGAAAGLRPGGAFVIEAYRPEQIAFGTGGPKDATLLPDLPELTAELSVLTMEVGREVERDIAEGSYHLGRSAVVQVLARRPASAG